MQDLTEDPAAIRRLLGIAANKGIGLDLTPEGEQPRSTLELTLYDEFQNKIDGLKRVKGEEGMPSIFKSAIPAIPDIEAYLQTANVRIVHGFPREAADLPCVAISLAGEGEFKFIGQIQEELIPEVGFTRVEEGSHAQADYHLHILSPNYDETVILFHLVKYALQKYRVHLEGYGLREATMNWQPVELAPEYLQGGVHVYQRSCVISLTKHDSFEYRRPAYTGLGYGVPAGEDVVAGGAIIPPAPGDQ